MLKVLDLFSGIGGFSYGLEKTGGFETIAFCEIDKHARKVLSKYWPNVKQYENITELTYEKLQKDNLIPEVISGGFPCQDISVAGKQAGIIGQRSGLWSEFARLIKDVRPAWAIIENVSALKSKGLTLVLQDLAEIGYNAEWHCIPCSALGGLHRRDRIWIIAYPMENSRCTLGQGSFIEGENAEKIARRITDQLERSSSTPQSDVANSESKFSEWPQPEGNSSGESQTQIGNGSSNQRNLANPSSFGSSSKPKRDSRSMGKESKREEETRNKSTIRSETCSSDVANTNNTSSKGNGSTFGVQEEYSNIDSSSSNEPQQIIGRQELELFAQYAQIFWAIEPDVGRVANGIPNRLHRLRQLGNSVVPQIPEFLGHCILNQQDEANRG